MGSSADPKDAGRPGLSEPRRSPPPNMTCARSAFGGQASRCEDVCPEHCGRAQVRDSDLLPGEFVRVSGGLQQLLSRTVVSGGECQVGPLAFY